MWFLWTGGEAFVPSPLPSEEVNRVLHEEEFRDVFISGLSHAWENITQAFASLTSDVPHVQIASLPDLPQGIHNRLTELSQASASEDDLYAIAEAVTEWIANAADSEQAVLATYLQELPARSARILLSSFADGGVHFTSEQLLWTVAGFLDSEDERLAQAAAVWLLECGNALGRRILLGRMTEAESIPHAQLIQGIMELLASK
jgi:hypothetical protein